MSDSRQSQQRTGQRVEWVTFLNGSSGPRVDVHVRSPMTHVCLQQFEMSQLIPEMLHASLPSIVVTGNG